MSCQYEEFFKEADKDGSGFLTYRELSSILKSKGYTGCDDQLKDIFDKADSGDDDKISFDEYMAAMSAAPPANHRGAQMRSVFSSFDKDGSGEITADELKSNYDAFRRFLTEEESERMVGLCDTDGSGTINYEEFIKKVFNQ